jgi:2-keto-4-pentenoate hydratase
MLAQTEIQALAREIFDQHERRETFKAIPERIPTVDDAHDIQDAYVKLLCAKDHTTVGGYKIALSSKQTRDWLKIHEPAAGQVLATRIHTSPHTVKVADYVRFSCELETCVVLENDMAGPCTVDDVRRNLRSVHSSYELIEDRAADLTKLDAKSLASDNSWNAGIVIGPPAPLDLDLANRPGTLKVNGVVTERGTTAETIGGDPLAVVAWLAGHFGKRGQCIKAGYPIITGSIVKSQFIGAGNVLEFAMDGMPPVILNLV